MIGLCEKLPIFLWLLISLGAITFRETIVSWKTKVPLSSSSSTTTNQYASVVPSNTNKNTTTIDAENLYPQPKKVERNEFTLTTTNGDDDTLFEADDEESLEYVKPTDEEEDDDSETNEVPLCNREQIIDGKWTKELMKHPPYITPTKHLRCFDHDVYYNSPYPTWKWYPNDKKDGVCEFNRFSSTTFCNLMENTIISVIGDSLSWEQYSSLIQLNGRRTHQNFQHQSRELNMNIIQTVCDGKTAIIYRRDDKLQNITSSIKEHFPTILILNRGAHYVSDDEFIPNIRNNIQEVHDWLNECDKRKLHCHFFWRTSVPGHPKCWNYTEPVNDLHTMESLITNKNNYNEYTMSYHWYDYQNQNEIVLQELEKSNIENYNVIDGYYINILRPDEHRAHQNDCLHNCYPGKMDIYNQLLLHYLRIHDYNNKLKNPVRTIIPKDTIYDPIATEEARKIREGNKKKKYHHL